MTPSELLNGKEKCTVIESYVGDVVVCRPGFRQEFKTLELAKAFIEEKGWVVNIGFIKASPLWRELNMEKK